MSVATFRLGQGGRIIIDGTGMKLPRNLRVEFNRKEVALYGPLTELAYRQEGVNVLITGNTEPVTVTNPSLPGIKAGKITATNIVQGVQVVGDSSRGGSEELIIEVPPVTVFELRNMSSNDTITPAEGQIIVLA